MDEEVQAVRNNGTWILVPRRLHINIVGSKWVFRTDSIERLKARLVARAIHKYPVLTILIHSAMLSRLP